MSRRNSKIPHTVLTEADGKMENGKQNETNSSKSTVAVNSLYGMSSRGDDCNLCGSSICKNSDCVRELKWQYRFKKSVENRFNDFVRPMTKSHVSIPGAEAKAWERILYDFRLPMTGDISRLMTLVLMAFFLWAGLWALLSKDMLPNGNFFGLYIMLVFALIVGYLVERIKLAPLLGMLIVGCILRNAYPVNYAQYIDRKWSSSIRNVALTIILTRAGLGLDQGAIRKQLGVFISLATVPTIFITVFITVVGHYMIDFPWLFAAALGFLISAVSPAVIVPIMLVFQERKLGGTKGIPSLVIASATINDVIAICGNGILLGIALSNGSLAWNIGAIPLTIVVGIGYGFACGWLLWFFPSGDDDGRTIFRFILLICFGVLSIFGSTVVNLRGAGALGALVTPIVATHKWRQNGHGPSIAAISLALKYCWVIFQPLLFGLIGAEVDFNFLIPERVGLAIGLLLAAHAFQFLSTLLATCRFGFNWRENIFLAISFLPKATIQAAIGSAALDIATKTNASPEMIQLGRDTLNFAVLSILFMAPIGGVSLLLAGPSLLEPPPVVVHAEIPLSPEEEESKDKIRRSSSEGDPTDKRAIEMEIIANNNLQNDVQRRASVLNEIDLNLKRNSAADVRSVSHHQV